MSNAKADLHNMNEFEIYSSYCPESKLQIYCGQITVKTGRNLRISNPKADLHNIIAHTKFGETPLTFIKVFVQK